MNNRIKGPESGGVEMAYGRRVDKTQRTAAVSNATSNVQPKGESVSLTDAAVQMSSLQQAVAKLPEINQARVERVKQALAKGEYAVDAGKIADRLLQLESDLAATDQKSQP